MNISNYNEYMLARGTTGMKAYHHGPQDSRGPQHSRGPQGGSRGPQGGHAGRTGAHAGRTGRGALSQCAAYLGTGIKLMFLYTKTQLLNGSKSL